MLRLTNAELEVYKPDNTTTTPDFTIPNQDILGVSLQRRLNSVMDSGDFVIDNKGEPYIGTDEITTGDKLVYRVAFEDSTGLEDYWTAIAQPPSYESGPGQQQIRVNANDFVFQVLNWRIVLGNFEGQQVAGTTDSIVNTAVTNNAPEVGTSQIDSFTTQTDYFAEGTRLFDMVQELADQAGAITTNDGEDLVFTEIGELSASVTLRTGAAGNIQTYSKSGSDTQLVNQVRVEGGTSQAVDDSQTTQSAYTTVTDSSRLTVQLNSRKSEIDRVEIYTRTTGSGESVTARIQKDDAGAPVDVTDTNSDIARRRLASDFLDSDGFTTFILPNHSLPDPDPWLIIEAGGSTGQDIGVNGSGVPAYKAYYPYPLDVRASEQDSIDEYRRREERYKDDTLQTLDAARDRANAVLNRKAMPRDLLTFDADAPETHRLKPIDVVRANLSDVGVDGSYVVTRVEHDFDGTQLVSSVEAENTNTI